MKQWLKLKIFRKFNISFSKSGDDIQLHKLINESTPGAYVDIGCWHPVKANNTYFFSLRNWKGICIDPNPTLKDIYKRERPKDLLVTCGVGNSSANLDYYMLPEDMSSMNTFSLEFLKDNNIDDKIVKKIKVPIKPLSVILDEHLTVKDRLDFFDIDVEGLDLEVLMSNNWDKYRPKVIVIETNKTIENDLTSKIVNYLIEKDYKLIGKSVIGGNLGNLFLMNTRK